MTPPPSAGGGTNWPGGSLDPETGIAYLYSFTNVTALGLINDPELSDDVRVHELLL